MISDTEKNIAALAARFVNNTNRHVFLTGKAGTGKTTFLRYITTHTHKQAVIAAPTGVAAINAGGVTLHSLFQLPFGAYVPVASLPAGLNNHHINTRESLIRGLQIRGNKRRLLQELELLIIDEVSMLRADLLDAISTVLQVVRRQGNVPFGGVQVLFIGDLLQLPPVVKDQEWQVLQHYYASPFFFSAHCLQDNYKPLYLELDKVYRQSDDTFIKLLNNLRHNRLLPQDIDVLNSHYKPGFRPTSEEPYILLTTHNHKADVVNRESLQKLSGKSWFFKAEIEKDYPEQMYPLDATMELKAGAQVMFIKNDPSGEKRFFNGKIGRIATIAQDRFEVAFPDTNEPLVKVEKFEWQNIRYRFNEVTNEVEEEVLGTFKQYPIRLAWAITVHKSQGLTFEKAILDLGSAFAPGQVYVALSRLVSLKGLILSSPVPRILPDQDLAITGFSGTKEQEPLESVLETESQTFLKESLRRYFDFNPCASRLQHHMANYTQEEHKSVRQKFLPWAQELLEAFRQQKLVADKFGQQLARLSAQTPMPINQLEERINSAAEYFRPRLKELSQSVLTQIGKVGKEKKTKQYLAELIELESYLFRLQQQLEKAAALLISFREGTELTRSEVPKVELKERVQFTETSKAGKIGRIRKNAGEEKEVKAEKKIKGQTQEESYKLFKAGHSLEEIAKIRGFSMITIEGHLAKYVEMGAISIEKFLDPVKVDQILTVARTVDSDQLSPIKQLLGEEFSYTDIRFAVAYAKWLKTL